MSAAEETAALAERIGYRFHDTGLLARALCHRSWSAEHPGYEPNERLEFLGDAVLGLIVTDHVFSIYPDLDEGWLSRARASVVRASTLAELAIELRIGEALLFGKGEAASGGATKPSILADALEAVIGAVYLDGGWPAAERFVLDLVAPRIALLPGGRGDQDDKSRLAELSLRWLREPPVYEVAEEGPDHDKTFEATVRLGGRARGGGTGRSKKQAEQLAAGEALAGLLADFGPGADPPPDAASARPADPAVTRPSPARTQERTDA